MANQSENAPPLRISPDRQHEPWLSRAIRVLLMVHELHKVGYQRLRIAPGLSPSGMHWRCSIISASDVNESGWQPTTYVWGTPDNPMSEAFYTSGQEARYFGWDDAEGDNARTLAAKFIHRFGDLSLKGVGLDYPYSGWFTWMLGNAEAGRLPIFYSDEGSEHKGDELPPPP